MTAEVHWTVGERSLARAVGEPRGYREETMFEAQRTTTRGRPWHLWLIGAIGGLWSSIGVLSFILTQMNVEAVMSRFPPQQREYFESFPLWAVAFWAIGVFGGVIGCLLLLLKNRLAFHVLLASVIGAIVSNLGGLFLLGGMEVMGGTPDILFHCPAAQQPIPRARLCVGAWNDSSTA